MTREKICQTIIIILFEFSNCNFIAHSFFVTDKFSWTFKFCSGCLNISINLNMALVGAIILCEKI